MTTHIEKMVTQGQHYHDVDAHLHGGVASRMKIAFSGCGGTIDIGIGDNVDITHYNDGKQAAVLRVEESVVAKGGVLRTLGSWLVNQEPAPTPAAPAPVKTKNEVVINGGTGVNCRADSKTGKMKVIGAIGNNSTVTSLKGTRAGSVGRECVVMSHEGSVTIGVNVIEGERRKFSGIGPVGERSILEASRDVAAGDVTSATIKAGISGEVDLRNTFGACKVESGRDLTVRGDVVTVDGKAAHLKSLTGPVKVGGHIGEGAVVESPIAIYAKSADPTAKLNAPKVVFGQALDR